MNDSLIRVLVVDDSAFNRRTISDILESSGVAKVVGVARDGEEAIKKTFDTKPDLITLDLEMPRMDGFTFLRIIMKSLPTPIIIISSRHEDKNVFKALELGAIDFLAKPSNHVQATGVLKDEIFNKLMVVRELKFRNVQKQLSKISSPAIRSATIPEPLPRAVSSGKPCAVVIGASTGGPSALQSLICSLPENIDASILISQHMPAGFTRAFSERLDRNSQLRVKEAEDGDSIEKGRVLVAPGGYNLMVRKKGGEAVAMVKDRGEHDKYLPSVNQLFKSAAKTFAQRCLAVVLTGMGNDGAQGVSMIKEAGGQIIAESEKTSIVFGMPREAINTNHVDEVLNLEDISHAILKRCRTK